MKKQLFIAVVLLYLIVGAACTRLTTIRGTIADYDGEMIISRVDEQVDTLEVSPEGKFELKLEVAAPGTEGAVISMGDLPAIEFRVNPGSVIEFATGKDAEGNPTISFTGDNAGLNNYLSTVSFKENFMKQEDIAAMSFADYSVKVEQMIAQLREMLSAVEDAKMRTTLESELELIEKLKKIEYVWAAMRINEAAPDADADYVKFVESIDLNDRRVIGEEYGMGKYMGLLEQRLMWEEARNPDLSQGANSSIRMMGTIKRLISDQDVRNVMSMQNAFLYFILGADEYMKETVEAFKDVNNDPENIAQIEKQYLELDELGPGNMAPDFALIDVDGNKRMLSDLRGKVLYIDVWATWCGPCVAEIPYVEKMWEKYRDNEHLEFVSVSVDDDVDAWKKKLADDKPGWKNYVVEGGFRGPMNQLYHISGIPRFLLIDKDGSIITVNASRPSSENFEKELEPYLFPDKN